MSKQQTNAGMVPAPSISLFLTNLHLLDLDRRHDWPSITSQTFTRKNTLQNEKDRIRCVEWALYRFFEIWDIEETRNKLGPFFPAFVPLQSLNLRAALFRCLNELKKNEALGKEVIIRKTMFDDCKGEKLQELLASFSTIVLRKVLAEGHGGKASIAGRLAVAKRVTRKEHESFLPLAVAHRSSLTSLLQRKQELRARYGGFGKVLDSKEQELDQRFEAIVKTQEFLDKNPIPDHTVARVSKLIEKHWQGDARLVDVIREGEEQSVRDSLLDEPFSNIWPQVSKGDFNGPVGLTRDGLLEDLEKRVANQEARLSQWKGFKEAMERDAKHTTPLKAQSPTLARHRSVKPDLRKQRDLVFSPRKSPRKSNLKAEEHESSNEWKTTWAHSPDLRKEGDLVFKSPRKSDSEIAGEEGHNPSSSPTSTSVKIDISAPPSSMKVLTCDKDGKAAESIVNETRNGSRLRTSSEDSSLNDSVQSGFSEISGGQLHFMEQPKDFENTEDFRRIRLVNDVTRGHKDMESSEAHEQRSHQSNRSSNTKRGEDISEDDLAAQIVTMTLNADPTPAKPKLSLVERTRQSILTSATPARLERLTLADNDSPSPFPTTITTQKDPSTTHPNPPATLLERTRKSISLVPSRPSRKSMDGRRNSKIYPTNQFETPRKQMPGIQEFTPPEELFSPGAGYESVFKSRPKVGFSPVGSPVPPD